MTVRLSSKALLFAFVAVTCPAVWAAPVHDIVISVKGSQLKFDHKAGTGAAGFACVKDGHTVQWSCGGGCAQIEIKFTSKYKPCKGNTDPAKGAKPFCDAISTSNAEKCVKAGQDKTCFAYTATLFDKDGKQIDATEDPEFIVDDNGIDVKAMAFGGVGGAGLFGAGFFLYRRYRLAGAKRSGNS